MIKLLKRYSCLSSFTVSTLFTGSCYGQNSLSGSVMDISETAIPGVRVTLFDSAQTYFQEVRTNIAGDYIFSNVPSGNYLIGAEKINKEYTEKPIAVPFGSSMSITLNEETNEGNWEVIVQSPEALGGTDLGALMPDGRIYYCHSTVDPFYFDPILNDTISAKGSGNNQGCVGPLLTEDGKVWFLGGTLQEIYGPGTNKVKWFDPSLNKWEYQPNMLDYRWYPTVARLPSGKFLVAGGGNLNNPVRTNTAEVYDPLTGTSFFTNDLAIGNEISPIVVLYNGKVLMTHRPPQLFDPSTNQWKNAGSFVQGPRMPNGDHSDCEMVLMPDGEAIAFGYKTFNPGVYGTFVERYNPDLDSWSLGSSMLPIRSRPKTCLLPNKKILVMAGYKEDTTNIQTNQWGYMNLCDMYDPANDSWRRMDHLNYFREYHALSILVPDGRVILVGGEGQPGNEPTFSVIEAFKPPYLFRGVRPEIMNLNSTSFAMGAKIDFDFQKTDSVTEVILMSNAVVTHFMNSGTNRFLSLDYSQSGHHVTAHLPSDSIRLIPGYYMLFVMVDDIPSIGQIVQIKNEVVDVQKEIGFLDSTFVWTENHQYCCAGGSQSFKYTFDASPTILAGKTYYELLQTEEENSQDWGNTGKFIRSENNVVYLYQSPEEDELYNFNLMIGDTFQYAFTEIVDSIDTIVLLNGEVRKRWKLRCIYDDPETAIYSEWIQGIGDINGLFAVNSATNCTADGDGSDIMCMYRNDTLIYDDPLIDGCWLLPTSIHEEKMDNVIFVPNPTSDFISITGLNAKLKNIRIYNIMGQLVYEGNNRSMDVHDFSPGYYYALMITKGHSIISRGFIKL